MHLGFGLYRHMLTTDNYKFARQCGATHLVVHLVDYFGQQKDSGNTAQPLGSSDGWGFTAGDKQIWSVASLLKIKQEINAAGLRWEAIENLDPAHWYDILLDGPEKESQMEFVKEIVRNMGAAGIPILGYNFSIAGVTGRIAGDFARGSARSVGMNGPVVQTPVPNGMVWNMWYNKSPEKGNIARFDHEKLWSRLTWFLQELTPVAEAAGVRLAAHPDDPPTAYLRDTPRLVYQPSMYQRLLDIYPSNHNALEYCLGSLSEMTEGDIYAYTDQYAAQGKIGYVHFRNVVGKVPDYKEVFIDEGDMDMIRLLRIFKKHAYPGILVPDHTPQMSCDASWYAGMAYAMGYMKAAIQLI